MFACALPPALSTSLQLQTVLRQRPQQEQQRAHQHQQRRWQHEETRGGAYLSDLACASLQSGAAPLGHIPRRWRRQGRANSHRLAVIGQCSGLGDAKRVTRTAVEQTDRNGASFSNGNSSGSNGACGTVGGHRNDLLSALAASSPAPSAAASTETVRAVATVAEGVEVGESTRDPIDVEGNSNSSSNRNTDSTPIRTNTSKAIEYEAPGFAKTEEREKVYVCCFSCGLVILIVKRGPRLSCVVRPV